MLDPKYSNQQLKNQMNAEINAAISKNIINIPTNSTVFFAIAFPDNTVGILIITKFGNGQVEVAEIGNVLPGLRNTPGLRNGN